MIGLNLNSNFTEKWYFGTRPGLAVYLGDILLFAKGATVYSGLSKDQVVPDVVESGTASVTFLNVLEGPDSSV